MGYKVKWVENNLGITRKALRGFENAGLMPKNGACKYESGKYRDYTEDDVDRLWAIRVMQGMGYTLKEIAQIISDETFDFDNSIALKITELEKEKSNIERHLGYAKMIKLTGRFPSRPAKMGEIKFDDFQQQAIEGWNIIDDPKALEYQKIAENYLSKTPEEFDQTDLGRMFTFLESISNMDTEEFLIEHMLPKAIINRINLGPGNCEVQLMVKMIYENHIKLCGESGISKKDFSRFYSSSYLCGDIAKLKANTLTEKEKLFIADAVAIFGGYKNYDELLEKETLL